MTIVEDKKEYAKQLDIIKNDDNGITTKKQALEKLTSAYNSILAQEPKSELDNPNTISAKFLAKIGSKSVVWNEIELTDSELKEINSLERVRTMAYNWVKQNHPNENDQTDKFGMIVNARMQLIIASRQ